MMFIAKSNMKSIIFLSLLVVAVEAQQDIIIQSSGRIAEHTPYHCLIRVDRNTTQLWLNAGNIISPKHILTSANVLWQEANFHVGVGSNRLDQLIYYAVERKYAHPNYLHVDKRFSIGVIALQHSLTFNSFVQPIALPPLGVHGPLWQEQGHVSSFDPDTGILKTAYQRINNETYLNMGQDSKIWGEYEKLNGTEKCINVAPGSGFIVRYFGVDTIMGLAIAGGYCETDIPTVYARVTKGREWIHEQFGI